MKSGKKLIALFLGIVMVMGLLPMTAFAEGERATAALEGADATVTVKPAITWERTKELVYSETGLAGLYADEKDGYEKVDSSTSNGTTTYKGTISWDFTKVSEALASADTVSGEENVWDYGKSTQYANTDSSKTDGTSIVPQEGVSAATWNNRSYKKQTVTYYENSTKQSVDYELGGLDTGHAGSYTVRKFSGTFAWPEGYDLTSNIGILSKNDANYQGIYDAVAADADLTAAFGGNKVIAVNDDMYVFVYKDGDTLTSENYKNYLAFWTGTAGKGVWSWENSQPQDRNWGNAWQQTTPATFDNQYALRAFHSIMPNMDTTHAGTNGREKLSDDTLAKLNQSDGWYSFADGNSVSTVLNNQYKDNITPGDTFHIDIYCIDTDKVGGMDELELQFTKAAPTEANVTVRYWLNTVGADTDDSNFLGESTMTNQAIGSTITLSGGTAVNQLNYKKADAIAKNKNSDVADGVQMNALVVTANSDENIINVVYLPAGQKVVQLYAGKDTVPYDGNAHTVKDVTIKENGYNDIVVPDIVVPDSVATKSYELNDGTKNTVVNITAQRTETLPGSYDVPFTSESFVRTQNGTPLSNYTVIQHPGKLTITYAPPAATCTYDFGVTNRYDVLKDVEKQAQSITASADCVTVENGVVLYTPQSVNTGETVSLTLTYAGGYTCTKEISFYPATNVLYEENFMKNDETNGNWVTEGADGDTVVNDNATTVYGYTEAYEDFNGLSKDGALKATLNLNGGRRASTSDAVTFTFKGTGFDLISECGTDTGMLVVGVKNEKGQAVKACVVDTYFRGDDEIITGSGILNYQVPVVRSMDLPYDTYTVTVYGYLTDGSGASAGTQSSGLLAAQAMPAGNGKAIDTDTILRDLGMSEYLDTDVSVSFMDDNSVLNGGSGAAAKETKPSGLLDWVKRLFSGRIAVQSTESGNTGDVNVYLDAFRVYQPLGTDETNYADNEQGLKYGSFYDYVVGSAQDVAEGSADGSMVYMEYDGEQDIAVIRDYKKQGPQNEVYLSAGNYVGFVLNGYTGAETVMVSAKAVQEGAELAYVKDLEPAAVSVNLSAAEMYYDVTDYVQKHEDYYYLILGNQGNGVLALSGIKLAEDITPAESEKLTGFIKPEASGDKFNPETFEVKYTETVKVGKKTALNVKTSLEVDHIAVYSDPDLAESVKGDVLPNNRKAVANGKAKLYSFNVSVPIHTAGGNTFYVVAYDSKGNASAPVAVTVTGK